MTFSAWQKRTFAVILGAVAILGAYDIVTVYATGGKDATISVIISWASTRWPAIAFFFGFLMGHFFGQNVTPKLADVYYAKRAGLSVREAVSHARRLKKGQISAYRPR